jgi:hypothetical protein
VPFAGECQSSVLCAANLYNPAIAGHHDHPYAVCILARGWLFVIWRCWQNNSPYNPVKHRALQILVNQDQHSEAA